MLTNILAKYGMENAESGGKYPDLRQPLDPKTGYWIKSSYTSKPTRLIVHFDLQQKGYPASIPSHNNPGTFAYANTAHRPVGGLVVRILPVFRLAHGEYLDHPEWEWLLWYVFWPKLENGSSGQVFDQFNPQNGRFNYLGKNPPYIAAGLLALNKPDEAVVLKANNQTVKYADLTESLQRLIQIDPVGEAK